MSRITEITTAINDNKGKLNEELKKSIQTVSQRGLK